MSNINYLIWYYLDFSLQAQWFYLTTTGFMMHDAFRGDHWSEAGPLNGDGCPVRGSLYCGPSPLWTDKQSENVAFMYSSDAGGKNLKQQHLSTSLWKTIIQRHR